ncbi:MAG: CoA-binding protein [Novosphingobium sp.]|nr:MAG: CoA-binding protein [Novosphingobium sp.]
MSSPSFMVFPFHVSSSSMSHPRQDFGRDIVGRVSAARAWHRAGARSEMRTGRSMAHDLETARHRLDPLIAPRSVALVGASERNHFAGLAMRALRGVGYAGPLHLVNPKAAPAFGLSAVARCSDIDAEVEAAYLCVPQGAVLDAAHDAIDAGIRNLIVVSGGFAEVGGEGVALEAQLAALSRDRGVRMLGPNCLGFRNNLASVALGSIPFIEQTTRPTIALVAASGSVASSVINYGIQQGIGFTHVIATGNEMDVTIADLIDYLTEIDEVLAIAVFIEGVKDPERFIAAAEKARAMHKPIVALKVGSAAATAAVAAAHTGAMVGDDCVFDAVCDRLGIVRVDTIEGLVNTAATIAATGPIARPGVTLVSMSGGVCEIASDYGAARGVAFPQFAEDTRAELAGQISVLGQMHNPLDLTGAAVRDEHLWATVPEIIARDPAIGLTLIAWNVPQVAEPSMPNTLDLIGKTVQNLATPALIVNNVEQPVNEYGRAYLASHGQLFSPPGLAHALDAVRGLWWWSSRLDRPAFAVSVPSDIKARPANERETLSHLSDYGVPVVPTRVARNADEAVAAAREIGGPVALKILSGQIAHKSEVGGVALNLLGDQAVASAYRAMMVAVAERAPGAVIEGVLVSPMRANGIELLVGIARDPQWGLVAAVGLGGFWVEALADTALMLLPATREDIVTALRSLRGFKMLDGYRGLPEADLEAVADAVVRIGDAALALGDDLAALEVNPLFVAGSHVEALDALAVFDGNTP